MTEPSVKQKLRRALLAALADCARVHYTIRVVDYGNYCFVATRKAEVRIVGVTLDGIPANRQYASNQDEVPVACSIELWVRDENGKFAEICPVGGKERERC